MQTQSLSALFAPISLADLPHMATGLIQAARIAIIAQRRSIDPLAALTQRLGNARRARHMLHLIQITGDLWPEPFLLSPPCCARLTHDEALFGTLAAHAEAGDRPGFDRAACDLIGEDARDQLWREFTLTLAA